MALDAMTLKAMQDYFAKNPGALSTYRGQPGHAYTQTFSGGTGSGEGAGGDAPTLMGYTGGDGQAYHAGQRGQAYDTQGNQTQDFAANNFNEKDWGDMIPYIIAAGTGAGMAGLLGPGAAIGGAGTAGGGGLSGMATGFTDAGTAGGALADTSYAANIAGTGGGSMVGSMGATAPAAGSSWLSSLLPSAGGGAGALGSVGSALGGLGSLAPILGGVLGAQKSNNTTTQDHRMDPRLDGAVYGQGGLVPQSQGLLSQQMDPARQQQWLDMQKQGQGLLSQPMAGNGYAQFAGRKL